MATDFSQMLPVNDYINIEMNGQNHIRYLYDAAGTKLRKYTAHERTDGHCILVKIAWKTMDDIIR